MQIHSINYYVPGVSQVVLVTENPLTHARSIPELGSLLEEGMETHSRILAERIPLGRGACWPTAHRVTKSWT